MGIGALRRYHPGPEEHVDEPGSVEVAQVVPEAPDPPSPPPGNASTDEWRAYATARGADPAEVAELSRDQLREQYGPKQD